MSDKNKMALLLARKDGLQAWLEEEAPYVPFDQKHLDAGTQERAYWHYGYHAALSDVLKLLRTGGQKLDSAGIQE